VLLLDAAPGYITWEEYQGNQCRLRENARPCSAGDGRGPPGQGCALLQGLAVCGACGRPMTVRYYQRYGRMVPWYTCQRKGIENGAACCQSLPGQGIDAAVGALLLERLTPVAVELAVAVPHELQARRREADELRRQQVERARYEADLARRRYVHVDPENRLVADTLEAEWNDQLRVLREAEERYEQQRHQDALELDTPTRAALSLLATDFARLWNDPATQDQDRKRVLRLLVEDVTIARTPTGLTAHVRFTGGVTHTIQLGRPQSAWEQRQTDPEVIRLIDELLERHTEGEVADLLNARGKMTGTGQCFTKQRVQFLRRTYELRGRFERLRAAGYLTAEEVATELGVGQQTVQLWRRHGLLRAAACNDRGDWLYEPLHGRRPFKQQGRKLTERVRPAPVESPA
jgi:Recombinase zinc beta ribbon domain/MerR HTH family regulatory protein